MIKKHKYGAISKVVDGIKFASTKEANRYVNLKFLEKHGKIENLKLQVPFLLYPNIYFDNITRSFTLNKRCGKHGFCIQRKSQYFADFVYKENGKTIIEDSKGVHTNVYKKKRNQMHKLYGIIIFET